LSSSRGLERLGSVIRAFWQAVWLGLLDPDALNEITWSYYIGKSGFESEDFNIHQGLWPWEADVIREHFKDKKHILVAGAGGGREVIALARLGYDVTAFDFSSYLTSACRRNIQKAGCHAQVFDTLPDKLPDGLGAYNALLIGRGFYHHIPSRTRRVAFLGACRAHLDLGAPIILSDFFTRSVDSKFYLQTRTVANILRWLRNHKEQVELGDWLTNCMQHAFTREEIEKEFLDAGIELEDYATSPFSEDSHLAHAVGHTK
jgi:2-polyprenyl-3-methyl-5-hydroxy-6-metoxy-1,4-benzoquinol methylase